MSYYLHPVGEHHALNQQVGGSVDSGEPSLEVEAAAHHLPSTRNLDVMTAAVQVGQRIALAAESAADGRRTTTRTTSTASRPNLLSQDRSAAVRSSVWTGWSGGMTVPNWTRCLRGWPGT